MGTPQGVSVAPRHGHHNSKKGGNKSALRTQRLLALLEKLAGQLTDGQPPWLSYKQPTPPLGPPF